MEKYYLAKLGASARLDKGVRLVEIQYARRAPSFGLVYLSRNVEAATQHELHVAALELGQNKEGASFQVVDRVALASWAPIDFDTFTWLEADSGDTSKCLLLARDTTSSSVGLIEVALMQDSSQAGKLKRLQLATSMDLQVATRCRMTRKEEASIIHLLADRTYKTFQTIHQQDTCRPLHAYSLTDEPGYLRLVDLTIQQEGNTGLALLELSDSSLRLVLNSTCLASFSLSEQLEQGFHQSHLLLTSGESEALLVTSTQDSVVAHTIQIGGNSNNEDPDNLLPREPSFELEKCWSLDLLDIDSIRAHQASGDDNSTKSSCCLCPMTAITAAAGGRGWPKFLLVAHHFHLLVYSFAAPQSASLPFSIVYDRSFLQHQASDLSLTQKSSSNKTQQQEQVDVRLRPRLVHNFRLIGPQPADLLFNTLLQARNDRLVSMRHFNQLGLIAGLTKSGHLLGFKFSSPRLVRKDHKDNLYQQLVGDSLRGSSRLLLDQADAMQQNLQKLRAEIAQLEESSDLNKPSATQHTIDESKLLQAELCQRQDIGGLYELRVNISELLQVDQLLVLATTSSHIMAPAHLEHIQQLHIDNEVAKSTSGKAILVGDGEGSSADHPIEACAVIDLDYKFRSVELSLPIFLTDGRGGELKVFWVLSGGARQAWPLSSASSSLISAGLVANTEMETTTNQVTKYHSVSLEIKPLISYQMPSSTRLANKTDKNNLSCRMRGPFSAQTMAAWLQHCLPTPVILPSHSLSSPFSHCSLSYHLEDGQLDLVSDDLFALELLKRHVLKEATDLSLKLDVEQVPPSLSNLRHLIELQTINLAQARKLREQSEVQNSRAKHERHQQQAELLLESLMGEISLNSNLALPVEFKAPPLDWLEESFRDDISTLISSAQERDDTGDKDRGESGPEKCLVFTDLVCGFIIDALVDFDQMFAADGHRASTEKMFEMRSKLLKLIMEEKKSGPLVSAVLAEWNGLR